MCARVLASKELLKDEMIPLLEPMLGMALAMNLAYLNLPIFSFLSQISDAVSAKIDSLPDATKRHVEGTQWFKEAVEIAKVKNLERMEFNNSRSGRWWTPFNSITCGILFNVLFKYRVGKAFSLILTAATCLLIILGVMINTDPASPATLLLLSWVPYPFWVGFVAFFWPLFAIGAGAVIRITTIRQLNYTLRDLGDDALSKANEALREAETAVKSA